MVLILLVLLSGVTLAHSALECAQCVSTVGWDDCLNKSVEIICAHQCFILEEKEPSSQNYLFKQGCIDNKDFCSVQPSERTFFCSVCSENQTLCVSVNHRIPVHEQRRAKESILVTSTDVTVMPSPKEAPSKAPPAIAREKELEHAIEHAMGNAHENKTSDESKQDSSISIHPDVVITGTTAKIDASHESKQHETKDTHPDMKPNTPLVKPNDILNPLVPNAHENNTSDENNRNKTFHFLHDNKSTTSIPKSITVAPHTKATSPTIETKHTVHHGVGNAHTNKTMDAHHGNNHTTPDSTGMSCNCTIYGIKLSSNGCLLHQVISGSDAIGAPVWSVGFIIMLNIIILSVWKTNVT